MGGPTRLGRLKPEESVCLRLRDQAGIPQGPQEALALPDISGTEIPLIVDEIIHQVVVFASNFHNTILHDPRSIVNGAWSLELVAFIFY